jgi:hypothetical protein
MSLHGGSALYALAFLCAVLVVALGSASFGPSGRISARAPLQSLVSRDVHLKGHRHRSQLEVRGPSHSIRLGSSGSTKAALPTVLIAQRLDAQRLLTWVAPTSRVPDYVRLRTRHPRAPPQALH